MTTAETEAAKFLASVAAGASAEAQRKNDKIEKIKDVLRTYFENDPWTEEHSELFDDMMTAQEALDEIVKILK